jgi:predicted nucleic acid-binding protein
LTEAPITVRNPRGLGAEAWRVADELGWARTYDAEYLALARLSGCRVVTADARLRRGADRTGLVVGPDEL